MTTAVMNPVATPRRVEHVMAERALTPRKRLGVISNQKVNADAVLDDLVHSLQTEHGFELVMKRTKTIQSRATPKEILEELARNCDAVVVGVGD